MRKCHPDLNMHMHTKNIENNLDIPFTFEPVCIKRPLYPYPFSRCSPAFFEEERGALEARRTKIRLLQQRKMSELQTFKDLPEEIPMHLVIGTKVTGEVW